MEVDKEDLVGALKLKLQDMQKLGEGKKIGPPPKQYNEPNLATKHNQVLEEKFLARGVKKKPQGLKRKEKGVRIGDGSAQRREAMQKGPGRTYPPKSLGKQKTVVWAQWLSSDDSKLKLGTSGKDDEGLVEVENATANGN